MKTNGGFGLVKYDAMRRALAECLTVNEAKGIRDKAEAVRAYARQAGDVEMQNWAAEIRLRAERRAGELLRDMKERGERESGKGQPKLVSQATTLNDLGITRSQSSKWQRLGRLSEDELNEVIAEVAATDELTTEAVLRILRAAGIKRGRKERHGQIVAPPDVFPVVYADPPWAYDDARKEMGGSAGQYSVLSTLDICGYPDSIGLKIHDDAVLFLWATVPMLPDALDVMAAWAFEYRTAYFWDKQLATLGSYNRGRVEMLLLGIKGGMPPPADSTQENLLSIKRGRHSAKPDEFRKIIEAGYGAHAKVELFAPKLVPGWTCLGYEIETPEPTMEAIDEGQRME